MEKKRKKLLNLLFLLVVFGLTIYSVFHGEDLKDVGSTIMEANPWDVLFGVVCVVFFIWGESIIIHYLLGTLKIKTKKRTCFIYSCVGFFFSCITPSAGGGQPAQIVYMRKNKIPIYVATLVMMIITITYKLVLVLIGLFLALFQRGFIHKYLMGILPIFYLGLCLNIICCAAMLVLVFHPDLAKNIILSCFKLLVKLHILKDRPGIAKRVMVSMDHYNATASYLKQHFGVIFHVMAITFLQRFALFFVSYFVYKAFGLHGARMYDVVMLQAVISVSVDMLPLPGGMGVSENLFLKIFRPIFYAGFLLPGMVLCRGIAYYAQLLLSAGVTMFAHFTIGKHPMEYGNT